MFVSFNKIENNGDLRDVIVKKSAIRRVENKGDHRYVTFYSKKDTAMKVKDEFWSLTDKLGA